MAAQPIIDVWHHRNFALYMGGMTPNLVSVWLMRVGVGWLAWELTNSTTWLGIIAVADLAPMLLLGLYAGAVTDRMEPLLQAKQMQWIALFHAIILTVFYYAGWLSIEILFLIQLALGISHPFASTARHAIVPATVPRDYFATAVATDSALFNGSRFVGPMFAALIIPWAGVGGTFAVHGIGCAIFLVALYMMDLEAPVRAHRSKGGLISDMGESVRYVMQHPGIWPLFLLLTMASTMVRPIQDMLPGFSGDVFQSGVTGLAWLTSGMGIGAMLSAIWVANYGRTAGLTTILFLAYLAAGLSTLGMVVTNYLWLGVLFSTLFGLSLNLMSTSTQALVQSAIDDSRRGRVMGLYTVVFRGMPAIGALFTGILAELMGLRITFAIAALICLAAYVYVLPRRAQMQAALEKDKV